MLLRNRVIQLAERISALDRLTDAKFVTFRTLIDSQAEKVKLALDAAQTAIDKAEIADEKSRDRLADDMKNRFESVNEFRNQQKDIIATFMPRAEFDQFRRAYDAAFNQMRDHYNEKLAEMSARLDEAKGRSGGYSGAWAIAAGVVSMVVIIINLGFFVLKG